MGSVMVMTVFLFQASALSAAMPTPSAATQHREMIALRVFIVPPRFVMTFFDFRGDSSGSREMRRAGHRPLSSPQYTSTCRLHLPCQDGGSDEVLCVSCDS